MFRVFALAVLALLAPLEGGGVMFAAKNIFLGRCAKAAPTAKSYVQDGLIAMWDGIENAGWGVHDAATTWKDLSGNDYDLVIQNGVWQGNSLFCNNVELAAKRDNTPSIVHGATFEACVNITATGNGGCVFYPGERARGIFLSNSSYIGETGISLIDTIVDGRVNNYYLVPRGVDVTLTAVYAAGGFSCFVNGEAVTMAGTFKTLAGTGSNRGDNCVVGSAQLNNAQHKIKGNVYRIGIYSRVLTAAEVAANYAIDKERFKLT